MDHKLMNRKSGTSSAGIASRDSPIERPCQLSFVLVLRSKLSLGVGILFIFLVLICTFDPSMILERQSTFSRKGGAEFISRFPFRSRVLQSSSLPSETTAIIYPGRHALQGMGVLFRNASGTMSELIVAHLAEKVSSSDFRLFLRALHRSGATARADVVLLYDSLFLKMINVIEDEEMSFQKLFSEGKSEVDKPVLLPLSTDPRLTATTHIGPFDSAAFRITRNSKLNVDNNNTNDQQALRWGSIIGFDLQELDPENALKGFLDMPSVQLRRWLCYQMLLGMVRQKYRYVLLTEVEGVVFVGDPLAAIRSRKQSLYLSTEDRSWSDVERLVNETKSRGNKSKSVTRQLLTESGVFSDGEEIGFPAESRDLGKDRESDLILEKQDQKIDPPGFELTGQKRLESVKTKVRTPSESRKRGGKKAIRGGSREERKPGQEQARSLIEAVHGKEVWDSLDVYDKTRSVVSSGVILGDIRSMRALTSKMSTEIVRVALQRKSRKLFHDKAILNYLVCKSSVLGKRTLENLLVVENKDSVVHCLRGSKQKNVFSRDNERTKFAVVQGYRDDHLEQGRGDAIAASVHRDICVSSFSAVYKDCPSSNSTEGLRNSA